MVRIFREISRFSKKEIDSLFLAAKPKARNPYFLLLQGAKGKEFGRLLPVVSKKVGNACVRNRIRRQLKSIFFTHKAYEAPFDYVVIVRRPAAELSFAQLQELFLKGLQK